MAEKGCVDGVLQDTDLYGSPVPWIGLYVAVATSVCFFCMAYDLVYGFFIRKKPFLPCKLFPMNAFTLTVLAVATKIPNDLVTEMPRVEDQISKLTGVALLCISVGYYMPSLGTMETSERYGNLAALTVTVVTMVVNVCIQIHTGVIFLFITEHIIMMVCIVVLLLLMWSSAVALRERIDVFRSINRMIMHGAGARVKDLDGLWNLIVDTHKYNYAGNRQSLFCKSPNHLTFGLVCVLSLVVVSQSMLKSFVLNSVKSCGTDESDYRWSIFIVIVVQFLTILVGSISIIYRWLSLLRHFDKFSLMASSPQLELEYLKLKTLFSLRFINNKKLSNFLLVAKDFVVDVFIWIQVILYKCNIFLVGFPVYYVKRLLVFIFTGRKSLKDEGTDSWTYEMCVKEMEGYRESYKRDCPSNLKALLSKCSPSGSISSECATTFIGNFEDRGKEWTKEIFELGTYRVSCLSVLVLSGILAELMPSSPRRESIMQSLKESFEVIYFVDRKATDTPNEDDERRWTLTKEVWRHWENPNHWFRTKLISCTYKGFKLKQVDDLRVLKDTLDAIKAHFTPETLREVTRKVFSLTERNMFHITNEFAIICKFIGEQNYGSVESLFDFLEMYFVMMVCFTLSRLPLAILKEIDGEDPNEIAEASIRKAFKCCSRLEFLFDTMEWSGPLAKHSPVGVSFAAAADGADAEARHLSLSNEIV